MKILIVGDLHLRTRTPRRRREPDFQAVCLGKLRQIMEIAEQADIVVQVGDFFDSPDPSKGLIAAVIEELYAGRRKRWGGDGPVNWYAIHGQHDLQYHSDVARGRSALRVLEAAQVVQLLGGPNVIIPYATWVVGASFGQRPPEAPGRGNLNMLVAHAMVGDKPLWPGQDLTGPEGYVRQYPGYDLYCLGDYHYPYSVQVGDAWVVNAGCVLRLTADERDRTRRPKVVLFDTDTRQPEDIYLDVTPEAEAFDLAGVEQGREAEAAKASFQAMADAMLRKGQTGVNFRENLVKAFVDLGTPQPVQDKVWKCWDGL